MLTSLISIEVDTNACLPTLLLLPLLPPKLYGHKIILLLFLFALLCFALSIRMYVYWSFQGPFSPENACSHPLSEDVLRNLWKLNYINTWSFACVNNACSQTWLSFNFVLNLVLRHTEIFNFYIVSSLWILGFLKADATQGDKTCVLNFL